MPRANKVPEGRSNRSKSAQLIEGFNRCASFKSLGPGASFKNLGSLRFGSLAFVEDVKNQLGIKALHREAEQIGEGYALREQSEPSGNSFPAYS